MLQIPASDAVPALLDSILFHSLGQHVKRVAALLEQRHLVPSLPGRALFPRVFFPSEWCLGGWLIHARIAVPARTGIVQGEVESLEEQRGLDGVGDPSQFRGAHRTDRLSLAPRTCTAKRPKKTMTLD